MTLKPQDKPTMYFIGVTTTQSSIMKIFPKWSDILSLDAQLIGYDAPIHAPDETYRAIVEHIKADPMTKGALVTTHKIDLLDACRDLFDTLDFYATTCEEVSAIASRDGQLHGYAVDPISSAITLKQFVPDNHWTDTHADVLCLGAGGAAVAISACMAEREKNHPRKFILVDIMQDRLDSIRRIHSRLDTDIQFEYHLISDASENDDLMSALPAGSMVINATGLGKDRPGSPLTDGAIFPQDGIVWELNYRGDRPFLKQAQSQADERNLMIEDGWVYFIHGWTQVITRVFDIKLTPELIEQLDDAASEARK